MKFLGLRIFIAILELIAFVLIMPCLIVIGWVLFGGEHPLSGQSLTQAAIVVAVVGGVLLAGIVVAAIASLLNLLLAIERNTANAAESAARIMETRSQTEAPSLGNRLPKDKTWRLAAAILGGVALVTILVYAFSSATGRHTTEQVKELAGGKPIAAQSSRDDWKQPSFDLEAHLDHTLANAPFTSGERAQIFRVIEDFAISEKQKEEPETLMSARVGSIGLAEDGSQQILVQGPYAAFCGASGNCPMWIFTTSRSGQLRLVLEMFGNAVILRATSNAGYRDLATASHFTAYEEYFSVYRWNGTKYDSVDCYKATFGSDRSSPPVIADCRPRY
jgi:hypothetical protein